MTPPEKYLPTIVSLLQESQPALERAYIDNRPYFEHGKEGDAQCRAENICYLLRGVVSELPKMNPDAEYDLLTAVVQTTYPDLASKCDVILGVHQLLRPLRDHARQGWRMLSLQRRSLEQYAEIGEKHPWMKKAPNFGSGAAALKHYFTKILFELRGRETQGDYQPPRPLDVIASEVVQDYLCWFENVAQECEADGRSKEWEQESAPRKESGAPDDIGKLASRVLDGLTNSHYLGQILALHEDKDGISHFGRITESYRKMVGPEKKTEDG